MEQNDRSDQELDSLLDSLNDPAGQPGQSTRAPQPAGKPVKKRKKKKSLVFPAVLAAVSLLVLAAGLGVLVMDMVSPRFAENVTVSGLNIGGMTYSSAIKAMNDRLTSEPVVIDLGVGTPLELPAQLIQPVIDSTRLTRDAQTTQKLDLADYLTIDEGAVRAALAARAGELGAGRTEASYGPEEPIPELGTDVYDPGQTPMPVYRVCTGTAGSSVDIDGLYARFCRTLSRYSHSVAAADLVDSRAPELPTAEQMLADVLCEPVNDTVDPDTGELIHGSYGVSIDTERLARELKDAEAGQTILIPLQATAPERMGEDAYFPDILGFVKTHHNTNEDRNTNLALACAAINGVVLEPGEVFSYNDTVGPRTEEAGFKKAPVYSGTSLVPDLGGGVCQVSSTLYLCSLFAELDAVERVNHGLPVNYLPLGLDATVSYGVVDLKLVNNTGRPVKIVAETDETYVYVWLMGIETRDYELKMRFSAGDFAAVARPVHYDRTTGQQLDTEQEIRAREAIRSGYLEEVMSLYGTIGSGDEYINTNCKPQEMVYPSQETAEAAKGWKAPNAFAVSETGE